MKISFNKSNIDLDKKVAEQTASGKVLLEVQNHEDGDFLIFGDKPLLSVEERIVAIETRLVALEKGKV